MKNWLTNVMAIALTLYFAGQGLAADGKALAPDTRCAVCGMFVAKYPEWVTQITMSDGSTRHFDGVKDMMAFSFAPQQYGAKAGTNPAGYLVKDYYTLEPVDGTKAFYVVGSDTTGPMGEELIPFATKDAAEAFSQDHNGKNVLTFAKITSEMIEAMRSGQKMK